ncbi:MAG: sporulation protein YunB [Oscillospiraceae bacterium]|nr:sporulation protein YunB [Oscillospiraceae bacterium]MDY2509320.1 sporulation protein YunB [Ruminococcus callidus]
MRRQTARMQKRQITIFLWSILIVTGILFGLVKLDRWIRPDVLAVCAQECRSAASVQIGESVHTVLQENGDTYSDFAVLLYDTNGNVTAVETLTTHINQIQAQLLTQINKDLQSAREETFPVSLGTATGVWLFAGKGPTLQMKMLPIGAADVKLVSQLESAGINQTCHTIRAEVTVTLQAAAPFYRTTTTAQFSYLLTETILVGNVPESYVVFGE